MIRVIFLIQDRELPSSRYRALQFLPRLRGEGIECDVAAIPTGPAARRKLFVRLSEYDVVFLQKKTFYPWTVRGLRKKARSLIYDLDDAVMFNDSFKGKFRSWRREWRFSATARSADIVLAGNSYLALQARPYARDVRVAPTAVDLSRYTPPAEPATDGSKTTIGWIGSRSTLQYLEVLRPALEEVWRRHQNAQLKLICNSFFDMENMPVIKSPWSEESEIRDLFSIDIGLAPAIDDPWCRGKCGLKIIQYLAARRAVVCSPVGVNRELVSDEETGLWARSPGEWVNQIGRLVQDRALRARLGEAGRRTVEERYSLDRVLPILVKAITDAARR